jgi:hypothetical protein
MGFQIKKWRSHFFIWYKAQKLWLLVQITQSKNLEAITIINMQYFD